MEQITSFETLPFSGFTEKLCQLISRFLADWNNKVVVDSQFFFFNLKPANVGVPDNCFLALGLFLQHTSGMLSISNIYRYEDDSTGDDIYSARSSISSEHVEEYWNQLLPEVKNWITDFSEWDCQNLTYCFKYLMILYTDSLSQHCNSALM